MMMDCDNLDLFNLFVQSLFNQLICTFENISVFSLSLEPWMKERHVEWQSYTVNITRTYTEQD